MWQNNGKFTKRISFRLVNNEKDFLKYTSRSTHITHKIFVKNYATIHKIKTVLMLNKPIYVIFTVLEISKWLMYDFHYGFIKKSFDAELLFTDTDSLAYEIKSEDPYEYFFKCKHLLDFINYPKDSMFFVETKKRVISKTKDESERKLINQEVLRHKMRRIQGKNIKWEHKKSTKYH